MWRRINKKTVMIFMLGGFTTVNLCYRKYTLMQNIKESHMPQHILYYKEVQGSAANARAALETIREQLQPSLRTLSDADRVAYCLLSYNGITESQNKSDGRFAVGLHVPDKEGANAEIQAAAQTVKLSQATLPDCNVLDLKVRKSIMNRSYRRKLLQILENKYIGKYHKDIRANLAHNPIVGEIMWSKDIEIFVPSVSDLKHYSFIPLSPANISAGILQRNRDPTASFRASPKP